MKQILKTTVLAAFALSFFALAPSRAMAACANPTGADGDMIYNTDYHVMQFCNNTAWISMAGSDGSGSGGGSATVTGTTKEVQFNNAGALAGATKLIWDETAGNLALGTTSSAAASALLDLTSTTQGFLPPRMTTTQRDAISSPATGLTIYNTTTGAMNVYSGSAWVALSSTSEVAFSASNSAAQTGITANTATKLVLNAESFDTNNNFVPGTGGTQSRFTPTVAGKYILNAGALCDVTGAGTYCGVEIRKNGSSTVVYSQTGSSASGIRPSATVSAVVDMNGSSDYAEVFVTTSGTTTLGSAAFNFFNGALISGGSGGGSGTPGGSTTQVQFNDGGAFGGDASYVWDKTAKVLDVTGSVKPSKVAMKMVTGAPAPTSGAGLWTTNGTDVWRASGKVGIGAAPGAALHVAGNSAVFVLQDTANTTASNALQGWMSFKDSAGTEYGWVGNGTTGSNDMTLRSSVGSVVLSTSGGSFKLDSSGSIIFTGILNGSFSNATRRVFIGNTGYLWSTLESGNNEWNVYLQRHSTSGGFMVFGYGTNSVGSITTNGTSTTYGTTSDYRLKEHVKPISNGLDTVLRLKPAHFNFKSDPNSQADGFIAHEVQAVAPYAVSGKKDAVDANGKPVYQVVDYGKLTPLLTAAIQELNAKVEAQKSEIEALKAQNAAILKRLDALEAK